MQIAVVHPGTQHAFRLVFELDRLGHDVTFFTGLAFRTSSSLVRLATSVHGPHRRIVASHTFQGAQGVDLRTRPVTSITALVAHKVGWHRAIPWRNNAFQRSVVRELASISPDAVIGFDTSSHIIAQQCASMHIPFILDQSIAPFAAKQRMLQHLTFKQPDWADTLHPKSEREHRNEGREIALATKIVAASAFTKDGLIESGVDPFRVEVIPFGVDPDRFNSTQDRTHTRARNALRFIFVGSVTARKGVPLLLEAWKNVRSAECELLLVGSISDEVRKLVPKSEDIKLTGPVPHAEVAALMAGSDVFVFPSLCEGFGLVLLEALASGLPVIATRATAAPDLIEGRGCGKIIEPNDAAGLAVAMRGYTEDRNRLRSEALQSVAIAREYSWDRYGQHWDRLLRMAVADRNEGPGGFHMHMGNCEDCEI